MASIELAQSSSSAAKPLVDRLRVAGRQHCRSGAGGHFHRQCLHGAGDNQPRLDPRHVLGRTARQRRRRADHDDAVRKLARPLWHSARRLADLLPLCAFPLQLRAFEPQCLLGALHHDRLLGRLRRLPRADRLFEIDCRLVRQGTRARARHRLLRRRARHAAAARAAPPMSSSPSAGAPPTSRSVSPPSSSPSR